MMFMSVIRSCPSVGSADRFIRAQVKSRQQWWTAEGKAAVQRLAQHGISFACRRYRYVGHRVRAGTTKLLLSSPMLVLLVR